MITSICVLVAHSCPTLCNPGDSSPPGSSVPEILQARLPEWVAHFLLQGWLGNQTQSPVLQADSSPSEPPGKLHLEYYTDLGRKEITLFQFIEVFSILFLSSWFSIMCICHDLICPLLRNALPFCDLLVWVWYHKECLLMCCLLVVEVSHQVGVLDGKCKFLFVGFNALTPECVRCLFLSALKQRKSSSSSVKVGKGISVYLIHFLLLVRFNVLS